MALRAAEPVIGLSTRVSKVAAATPVSGGDAARYSRSPDEAAPGRTVPFCSACWREDGRLSPKACVGAPATSRSMSSAAGAVLTSARVTSQVPARPSAIARAIFSVLPNMDSWTTSAFMALSVRAGQMRTSATSRRWVGWPGVP
ncbi:hypothetical protein [Actinoplanes subtropicus]|uniref:hypothetical protein n=1 Tax=Actinoplanes subtropicus TaxID=543632 RepID=UPI0012F8E7B5|nr:hypothetical protein [Actinoplanes subtropicus]